ncbi:MAG: hypothetical protein IPM18_01720 [Phycisphaerales bacterium]|nr:hypothetical protein [Phycisphaerales bacterium]
MILAALAPFALFVALYDSAGAVIVLAAAAGWGAWPARWLLRRSEFTRPQAFCVALALGLGVLATLVLAVGMLGWLRAAVGWGLVVGGALLGIGALRQSARSQPRGAALPSPAGEPRSAVLLRGLFALPLAVPLAIGLFGATLPPGVLWAGEGGGYDVLEYHLQGPREYFDAGHIHFLPHNVYTSFPQQMEMLYLLLMLLHGDPWSAAIPSQLLHLTCGLLAVSALAAFSPAGWGRWAVVLCTASVPWLAYTGVLAYVENGMLFFGAVAGGVLCVMLPERAGPSAATAAPPLRLLFVAGLCAGFAGGCKYTALVLAAIAAAVAWGCAARSRRTMGFLVFVCGAALAFAPWAVRNSVFTGNPVYPFAYSVFGGTAWSAAQDEQWQRGHAVQEGGGTLAVRLQIAWRELVTAPQFGGLIFAAGLLATGVARTRRTVFASVWALFMILAWLTLTHMPGRFLVPLLIPLAFLLAEATTRFSGPPGARPHHARIGALVVLAVGLALYHGVLLSQLFAAEQARWERGLQTPLRSLVGQTSLLREVHWLNRAVPPDARVRLIGEARIFYIQRAVDYAVVFNRDPWVTAAADLPAADAITALRGGGSTHVVFSWDEIDRLRGTYGFPEHVTPAWADALEQAGLERIPLSAEAFPAGVAVYRLPPRE